MLAREEPVTDSPTLSEFKVNVPVESSAETDAKTLPVNSERVVFAAPVTDIEVNVLVDPPSTIDV